MIIEYGTPIQKAASDCQENVRKAIETMTGLHVVRVDVHVQGVSFEQENKAIQSGQEVASIDSGFKPLKPMKVELVPDEDDLAEAKSEEEAKAETNNEAEEVEA